MAPATVPAITPSTNPHATRQSVANACWASSPLAARSAKAFQITDGGGTSRPLDQTIRTANSQTAANTLPPPLLLCRRWFDRYRHGDNRHKRTTDRNAVSTVSELQTAQL